MTAAMTQESTTNASGNDVIMNLFRRIIVQLQSVSDHMDDDGPQLTTQQLRVMRILYAEGPTRVSTLARRLNVSTPTVTGILDRLVQRGMTSREDDPRDRRVVLNVLTPEGISAIDRLHPADNERVKEAIAQLSEEELQDLTKSLTTLVTAVEQTR